MKCKLQMSYINNISQDWCCEIELSTVHAIDYGDNNTWIKCPISI